MEGPMIDAKNPVVRNRVTTLLWSMIEAEKKASEFHEVRSKLATLSDEGQNYEKFLAEVARSTAAELERIHNVFCSGVVVEVVSPFTPTPNEESL